MVLPSTLGYPCTSITKVGMSWCMANHFTKDIILIESFVKWFAIHHDILTFVNEVLILSLAPNTHLTTMKWLITTFYVPFLAVIHYTLCTPSLSTSILHTLMLCIEQHVHINSSYVCSYTSCLLSLQFNFFALNVFGMLNVLVKARSVDRTNE